MYLKNIEVQGFKSFAKKMNFDFHNGITAIVGPNGSGKSNVSDAVRWVLGEQSAKQLRGGNMQDVIFSGTEMRKPLGFASVAITLDNADHKLNVDFEEVTVTRRLYRSGESEYLLNGVNCRLKDIQELFYDTGIGKEGYSIIGQGQIDKILSGKPEERRELFDEAAGIVKFKRRKNTALKKLGEEQQNMVRVSDILAELTKQLAPLERQSEVAKLYLKKKEELRVLDVNMFLIDMEHTKGQLASIAEKYQIAHEDFTATEKSFEQTKQEYEKLEQSIEKIDEKIEKARETSSDNAMNKQRLESQISILREQINTAAQKDSYFRVRLEELKEDLEKREQEVQGYLAEQKKMGKEAEEVKQEADEKEAQVKNLQAEMAERSTVLETAKTEIFQIVNNRTSTKGKMQRYDAMVEQINIRKAELNQRLLQMKSEEVTQEKALTKYSKEYDELANAIGEYEKKQTKAEQEVGTLQATLAELNKQLEIGQTAYHREASRLESLRNITERYEGYGNSIRRVMEQKEKNKGIKGVVADLIKVPAKYETAIETALGGNIQNIVTDNESTAKYMIEYLKRNRFGRATFLPITNMKGKSGLSNDAALKEKGAIGLASTLVETGKQYQDLAAQLLGKTLVVDNIDNATVIANKYKHKIRMVTVEGELLSPGGSMTGGAFKNKSNLLGRKREIEDLERNVKQLQKEMLACQKEIDENRERRNGLRDDLVTINDNIQERQIRQNTVTLYVKQAQGKIVEVQSEYVQLTGESNEIEQQIKDISTNQKAIDEEVKASHGLEKAQEKIVETNQKSLGELQEKENVLKNTLEEIHIKYAGIEQKGSTLKEHLARIEEEQKALKASATQIQNEAEAGNADVEKKEADIAEIEKTIEAAIKTAQKDEDKVKKYQEEKETLAKGHREFFEKRDELSQHMSLMDKECFRLNSQKERLEENQEGQINYMWEEYELTPSAAGKLRDEEATDRVAIRKEINIIKDAIRSMGSVNVNAIEEFKNVQERHSFLAVQHADLVEAEETLLNIIEELDTAMRKQFAEKFKDISKEFDRVFKQLFGGGKGTLELIEDEDMLEAGIRIISQPPGKKLQNMMQLSGGEKALTAIALLFAIQNLKPSPFCLLDEIEAALDDTNVVRFAKYLDKLSSNTQFIIITHRRGTMIAADRLYGITMQEKGVSTLVSVNLIEHTLDK